MAASAGARGRELGLAGSLRWQSRFAAWANFKPPGRTPVAAQAPHAPDGDLASGPPPGRLGYGPMLGLGLGRGGLCVMGLLVIGVPAHDRAEAARGYAVAYGR